MVDPSYMSSYEVINKREFGDGGGGTGLVRSPINRDGRSRESRTTHKFHIVARSFTRAQEIRESRGTVARF